MDGDTKPTKERRRFRIGARANVLRDLEANDPEKFLELRQRLIWHFLEDDSVAEFFERLLEIAYSRDTPPKDALVALRLIVEIHDGPLGKKLEEKHTVDTTATVTVLRGPRAKELPDAERAGS